MAKEKEPVLMKWENYLPYCFSIELAEEGTVDRKTVQIKLESSS